MKKVLKFPEGNILLLDLLPIFCVLDLFEYTRSENLPLVSVLLNCVSLLPNCLVDATVCTLAH